MTQAGGDDELAGEIFAEGAEYAPGSPILKQFRPWHRPRKQFVRREQWSTQLKRLFAGRSDDAPLHYLGLPGVDLLDVRYLYEEICGPVERPFRFLGFNTEAQPGNDAHIELMTALAEVRQLPNVDPLSDVMPDDIRKIAVEESLAWNNLLDHGPFDVVNLDLCDGIAADPVLHRPSLYEALGRLVSLQVRSPRPWLLFVTTQIGHGSFDSEAEGALLEVFRSNIESCSGFVAACDRLLDGDPSETDPNQQSPQDFLRVMIVALCKWFVKLAQVQGANKVELGSTLGYRLQKTPGCEDLVSFALRFRPVIGAPTNPFQPTATGIDECATAEAIVKRAMKLGNVDEILADNPAIREEMVDETEGLLERTRYDIVPFRPWVDTD
jgi:hypothetical protein